MPNDQSNGILVPSSLRALTFSFCQRMRREDDHSRKYKKRPPLWRPSKLRLLSVDNNRSAIMVNISVVIALLDDDGFVAIPMISVADDVTITVPVTISVTLTDRYALVRSFSDPGLDGGSRRQQGAWRASGRKKCGRMSAQLRTERPTPARPRLRSCTVSAQVWARARPAALERATAAMPPFGPFRPPKITIGTFVPGAD
jgi:hypothetical protein